MRTYVVAALLDPLDDVRRIFADQAVEQVRGRKLQLVEHAEDAPDPDAEAVIAPGIIALRLGATPLRRIGASPGQKGEPLDIERHVEGKTLAVRPAVVGPLFDRRVIITTMSRQLEHRHILYGRRPQAKWQRDQSGSVSS